METSVSRARALAHPSRVGILDLLQRSDQPLGVHEVAPRLGLQRTTTRDHLEHLVAAGFVAKASEERSTRGRPRILYRAVDRPVVPAAGAWFREKLLEVLLEGYGMPVESRAAAAEDGGVRQAGAWTTERHLAAPEIGPRGAGVFTAPEELAQLAVIEAHLEDLGFEPEVDPDEPVIHMRRCPFLSLARAHTDVVCSVHLGLARGVLAQQDGPLVADRLQPFVGPEHCVLHLRREPSAAL